MKIKGRAAGRNADNTFWTIGRHGNQIESSQLHYKKALEIISPVHFILFYLHVMLNRYQSARTTRHVRFDVLFVRSKFCCVSIFQQLFCNVSAVTSLFNMLLRVYDA